MNWTINNSFKQLSLVVMLLVAFGGQINAQCTQYDPNSLWVDLQNNLPCGATCGTPTVTPFEIWSNEAYLLGDLKGGSQYVFTLGPSTGWNPTITVAAWNGTTPGAVAGFVNGRSLTVTIPSDGQYIVIISITGSCNGATTNNIDNGALSIDCGASGAGCLCTANMAYNATYNCDSSSVDLNVTSVDAAEIPYTVTVGGQSQTISAVGSYSFNSQPDDVIIPISILSTNGCTAESVVYADSCELNCSGGNNPIVDGSFEAAGWTETSLLDGAPSGFGIVDAQLPLAGSQSAWLGGFSDTSVTTISQALTIGTNASYNATLSFWMIMAGCDSPADSMVVRVDGNTEFVIAAGNAFCGDALWHRYEVDLLAYADGNSHTIEFIAYTYGVNGAASNFFVDKARMEVCTCPIMTSNNSSVASSCTANTGTATVTPTSGTPTYTYMWDAAAGNQTTATATGLAASTYGVTVVDMVGCELDTMVTVSNPAAVSVSIGSVVDARCNGNSDGRATATGTGGTGAITYMWSAGGQTTAMATGLAANTYSVVATDANSCTATASVTITEPSAVSVSISASSDVSCNGGTDGTATALGVGGTGFFTYMWDASAGGQTAAMATGLTAGSYSVSATDVNSCLTSILVTITEPSAVTATVMDNGDGTATAMGAGGTGAFTYMWDAAAANQTTATAAALMSGNTYCVTATDAKSCQDTACVMVLITGVDDLTTNGAFKVYPNPTTGNVFVELGLSNPAQVQVDVYNATGQNVMTKQLKGQAARIELSTGELPTGVYMIRFAVEEQVTTQKLIIQRP
ncbi:MAG: T9SS type A sorting domain-containing protein [Aureispira sp.]|nr:T9SS type A sorting domain-containing protein [Aureispira sp.]